MSENKTKFDNELDESIDHGVMYDKLNITKITFWSVLGIVILAILIYGVSEFYSYNKFLAQQASSTSVDFRDINKLKKSANEHLNNAGVIDADANKFHIPIEDAISIYLNEEEN